MIREISVFNLKSRVTSSLESYKAAVGKRFPAYGIFFRFMTLLISEEYATAIDFGRVVESDYQPAAKCKKTSNDRDEIIDNASNLLTNGEITIAQFLAKVVRQKNIKKTQLEYAEEDENDVDDEEINDLIDDVQENDEQNEVTGSQQVNVKNCFYCKTARADLVFIPCGHVIACSTCNQSNHFKKCFSCDLDITSAICMQL